MTDPIKLSGRGKTPIKAHLYSYISTCCRKETKDGAKRTTPRSACQNRRPAVENTLPPWTHLSSFGHLSDVKDSLPRWTQYMDRFVLQVLVTQVPCTKHRALISRNQDPELGMESCWNQGNWKYPQATNTSLSKGMALTSRFLIPLCLSPLYLTDMNKFIHS